MKEIIKCDNLSKVFNKETVVNGISLKVFQGDIYGFLGPNGSGKSTTIKMMLGLVKPTEGNISIFGYDVSKDREKAIEHIGAMVESPSFYPYLSGFNNLKLYANIYSLGNERILEVLEMVGLSSEKDKKVSKYSIGMKQRLAIARAFLNKPKVVILDEPTNGLDPQGVMEIRYLIKYLKEKEGVTFIVCSHILNEIEQLCNRIAIINKGNLLIEGNLNELVKEQSLEAYFLKTVNKEFKYGKVI